MYLKNWETVTKKWELEVDTVICGVDFPVSTLAQDFHDTIYGATYTAVFYKVD
jgi:hypothetical protein